MGKMEEQNGTDTEHCSWEREQVIALRAQKDVFVFFSPSFSNFYFILGFIYF